ncbi:MerR family transcriptional regulator [Micromonospora sp. NPDC049559]|uniref:MerR family transcriptional regulator n=1 Tax=Micromonospora sp. NPDC049559 TaxID=3155923 RepID=UPI00341380AE
MRSPDTGEELLSIGQLAARFGLATHVLRHWEAMGLLTPAARINGRRYYGREQLTRLGVIRLGKRAGLGLTELRQLLAGGDRAARDAILRRQLAALRQRIEQARASQRLIEHALDCPHPDYLSCPDFQRAVAAAVPAAPRGAA